MIKGLRYSKWKGCLFYVHNFIMTDLAEWWFRYEALICIWMLLSSGCCISVHLEMKFASVWFEFRYRILHFLCCLCEAIQDWLCWSKNSPKGFAWQTKNLNKILVVFLGFVISKQNLICPHNQGRPGRSMGRRLWMGNEALEAVQSALSERCTICWPWHCRVVCCCFIFHMKHENKDQGYQQLQIFQKPQKFSVVSLLNSGERICIALITVLQIS